MDIHNKRKIKPCAVMTAIIIAIRIIIALAAYMKHLSIRHTDGAGI